MQFTLTDLQNEIKENSNKLLKENIDLLETIQKVDENCRIDKKVWDLVIDQGWLALDVPEKDGGLGFSNTDTAILSEVLGYYMPIIPIFSSGVVFKHILMNSGLPIVKKVSLGDDTVVPFSELSKSGRLVNAYNALIMASKISR